MLPTPATRFWSSRNALTGARDVLRERVQVLGGELPRERLDAEPRVEERGERLGPERELAGPEAPRVVEHQLVVAEREPHARVPRRRVRVEQQRARHAQVHQQVDVVGELPDEVLAAARRAARRRGPAPRARAPPARAAGTSARRARPPPPAPAPRRGAPGGGGSSRLRAARASRPSRLVGGMCGEPASPAPCRSSRLENRFADSPRSTSAPARRRRPRPRGSTATS